MNKRLLFGLLTLLVCASLFGMLLPARAATVASGECGANGNNLRWSYDPETKNLKLTGSGAMCSYQPASAPWFPYADQIQTLTLPKEQTSIGDHAFFACTAIRSVSVPSKVTEIGTQAFACCESLRQILLPAGLQQLGAGAFQSCESLTDLSVPDAIEILPHSVFSGCSSLKSVELPAHLQEMQGMAFQDCTALTAVELPETLDMIGEAAFLNCQSLTAVTVPEGVTILSPSVFADCKALASVTLPENLLEIGANAFCNCMSLADLRFPENLKSIGAYAFEACTGLHSITLPASETKVGLCAFHGCNALKQMVVRNPDCLVGTGEALTAETPENLHLTGAAQLVSADRTASAAGSADSNEDLPFDQTMAPFTLGASAQTLLFGRHDALREQAQELVEEGRTFRTVESYAKAYGYRFYETNVFSDVLENELRGAMAKALQPEPTPHISVPEIPAPAVRWLPSSGVQWGGRNRQLPTIPSRTSTRRTTTSSRFSGPTKTESQAEPMRRTSAPRSRVHGRTSLCFCGVQWDVRRRASRNRFLKTSRRTDTTIKRRFGPWSMGSQAAQTRHISRPMQTVSARMW